MFVMRSAGAALGKAVPTAVTLGLLAALAIWGHHYDWKLAPPSRWWAGDAEKEKSSEEGRTRVETDPCTPALACGLGYVRAREADRRRVILPSEKAVASAGLETAEVSARPVEQGVEAVGELDFDRTRYAVLAPRAAGTVWHVAVKPGDAVKRGQTLALVEAADVGRAKTEFLNSLVQVETRADILSGLEKLPSSLVPAPQLRQARASLREGRIKLFNDHQVLSNLGLNIALKDVMDLKEEDAFKKVSALGVPEEMLRALPDEGRTANLLPLTAPFDGVIVSARKAKGEAVGPTEPQFVLADLGKLWLMLNVRPADAAGLSVGQDVFFTAAGVDGEVRGKLVWISPEVDEKTRVVSARVEVANPDGKLRPRTFGAARVVTRSKPNALTVPDDAVQADEGFNYVFVRAVEKTVFYARRVTLGGRQNGFTEIVEGVAAGETVATKGSHALKSELFKDRIGGEE
jgi:cobalt-zinc-cadmium efflux system membrane fusion protein